MKIIDISTKRTERAMVAIAQAVEQHSRATLDEHCEHDNLNAHKTRCLSCGMWLLLRQWPGAQ